MAITINPNSYAGSTVGTKGSTYYAYPAGISDNDFLVFIVGVGDDAPLAAPTSVGSWVTANRLGSATGNDGQLGIFYKQVYSAAAETSGMWWTIGSNDRWGYWFGALSGVDPSNPLDDTTMTGSSHINFISNGSPAPTYAQGISTSGALVFAAWTTIPDSAVTNPGSPPWTTLVSNGGYFTGTGSANFSLVYTIAPSGNLGSATLTGVTSTAEVYAGIFPFRPITYAPTITLNTPIDGTSGTGTINLFDNFNNSTFDTGKWASGGTANKLSISDGAVLFSSSSAEEESWLDSVNTFDLTGSSISVELVDNGLQNTSNAMWPVLFQDNAPRYIGWKINSGSISALYGSSQGTIPYNSEVHKFLRVRENNGSIIWDYSYNSVDWTNFYNTTSLNSVTGLTITVADTYSIGAAMSTRVDNVNIMRTNVTDLTPSLYFTGSDVDNDAISYAVQVDTLNTFDSTGSGFHERCDSAGSEVNAAIWSNPAYSYFSVGSPYIRMTMGTDVDGGLMTSVNFGLVSFSGQSLSARFDQMFSGTNNYNVLEVRFSGTDANSTGFAKFEYVNGSLDGVIRSSGTNDFIADAIYNSTSMKYLRIRHDATTGSLLFEASPEGVNYNTLFGSSFNLGNSINNSYAGLETFPGGGSVAGIGSALVTDIRFVNSPLIFSNSATDTGFADVTHAGSTSPFPSSDQISYTVQSDLTVGSVYYWRSMAIDNRNKNSGWSAPYTFYITTGGTPVSVILYNQLMMTGVGL